MRTLRPLVELTRPFTLLPPLLGMLSGAAAAFGAGVAEVTDGAAIVTLLLGALAASLLNGASNTLNQVEDLELDRINKPDRPLPRGAVTVRAAKALSLLLYIVSIATAFLLLLVRRQGYELGIIVVITAVLTWMYSSPPLRLRRSFWAGPLVIAIPRGGLLKVAGWATLAPVGESLEPWILAAVFFLFVLGCAPIKDFDDMEGDALGGASSLPLFLGPLGAARVMAPFFVLPWGLLFGATLLLPEVMSLRPAPTALLCLLLAGHGTSLAKKVLDAARANTTLGRGAWRSLYLLMMEAQVGLALLYVFWPNR